MELSSRNHDIGKDIAAVYVVYDGSAAMFSKNRTGLLPDELI